MSNVSEELLKLEALAAEVYPCRYGERFCPYFNNDDEFCIQCLTCIRMVIPKKLTE